MVEVHAFLSGGYIVTTHRRRVLGAGGSPRAAGRPVPALGAVRHLPGAGRADRHLLPGPRAARRPDRAARRARSSSGRRRTSWRRSAPCGGSWSSCGGSSPRSGTCWRGASTTSSKSPASRSDSRNYFRDVYDHSIRISDQIDSYRDLLSGSRDAYLSVVSNRLNQITKQLTVMATIFLPLSFVVGFFGQNFKWLVDQHPVAGGVLRARDRQPRAFGAWPCWPGSGAATTSETGIARNPV